MQKNNHYVKFVANMHNSFLIFVVNTLLDCIYALCEFIVILCVFHPIDVLKFHDITA